MNSEARRNMAVGVFAIVAFVLLAALILQFSNIAMLTGGGYNITVRMPHSGRTMPGKPVFFNGVTIGEVDDVRLAEGGRGVVITLTVNDGVAIPSNARFEARTSGLGEVVLDFVLPTDTTGEFVDPKPPLPTDGTATVEGVISGVDRFLSKFERLDHVINNLVEMTEPRLIADVDAGRARPNLTVAIARFDAAVARLANKENAQHLRELLQNAAAASTSFDETLRKTNRLLDQTTLAVTKVTGAVDKVTDDVDEVKQKTNLLLGKLYDDAVRLSNFLDTINSLAKGVQEGEGSLGKLLKSEDLHKELVLMMLEIQEASKAMKRLLIKLEKEGLTRSGG
jgi:ABC-type transporter Mla subunit MlaD